MSEEIKFETLDEVPEELMRIDSEGRVHIGDVVLKDFAELLRRAKAVECLSAEDARAWCKVSDTIWGGDIPRACDALRSYASVLEGSDE